MFVYISLRVDFLDDLKRDPQQKKLLLRLLSA